MRTVAAVIALVACVHAGLWALARDNIAAPGYEGQLASVSYAPFQGNANPDAGSQAQAAQIRADLKLLAPLTRAVRTYSATGGVELVPGIASEFGLRATIGAWIDKDKDRNGGKDMAALIHHMAEDELVGWAWDPGTGRTPAPGTQS